jgi:preprotein translocase subunit SecG
MQTVIIVVHLMLVLALIGVVLLQRSEGGGLGMGSGGGAGFMSSRGTANLLTRTTAFLAVGFFLTSLLLSWLAGYDRTPSSIVNPAAVPAAPGAPSVPQSGPSGNVLDQLKAREGAAPPAGPQVPQSK